MNRGSEEEQLTMVVKNLLPIYCKYLFAQYFPNFKALIIFGTQIDDAINNEDLPRFKKNLGSISQGLTPRPRREFHELYMPVSQVIEKLKAKCLLKPLDPRPTQTHCLQDLM